MPSIRFRTLEDNYGNKKLQYCEVYEETPTHTTSTPWRDVPNVKENCDYVVIKDSFGFLKNLIKVQSVFKELVHSDTNTTTYTLCFLIKILCFKLKLEYKSPIVPDFFLNNRFINYEKKLKDYKDSKNSLINF